MQRKLALLLTFSFLIGGSVFAYEYQGSTTEPPEDPDSVDEYAFDLDAAFTFSQGVPDVTGPSIYYGSKVMESRDGSIEEHPDEPAGTDAINKYYISRNEDTGWGQGEIQSTTVQIEDGIVRENYQGLPYLVAPPHPDADQAENRCGDSVLDSGNDESSCPEDYGLPSDDSDTGGESSDYSSEEPMGVTFIQQTGAYDINDIGSVSGVGDSGDDTDDHIAYDPGRDTFVAEEHNQDETEDITGNSEGSDTVIYEDENWEDLPDFYLSSNRKAIYMIYVEKTGSTPIQDSDNPVTTLDLTTDSYDDYDYGGYYSDTDCEASGGWECVGTDHDVDCKDISYNDETEYSLTEDTLTLTADNPTRFETSSGSQYGHSDYGVSESTSNDPGFEVEVTYNDDYETSSLEADNCAGGENGEITTYSCNNTSVGGSCSTSDGEVYYDEVTTGTYYDGTEEEEWEYRYQTLDYSTAKIFDVNPGENPSGNPLPSDEALFWNDQFKTNSGASTITYDSGSKSELSILSTGGTGYYSWEIANNETPLTNDPAVSVSTFSIDVEDETFHSVRDSHETYDADGPYGESDGYVAIRHDIQNEGTSNEQKDDLDYRIVGTTPLFTDEETSTDGSSTNFYDISYGNDPVWLSGCPGDQVKCVRGADVSLDNLETWSGPSPGSNDVTVTTTPAYATNASMGVCKMYQKISDDEEFDLDSSSNQQCEFEEGDYTDPGDPGDPGKPPNDCGSTPGERWHTMEGPEVQEDTFVNADEQEIIDAYEACVEHSQCVLSGEPVPEGRVANVASDANSGYETGGDSPDWEVCLNIHDAPGYQPIYTGYHEKGAHEFAGQWYDLDDDRVDYYLRPSNDNGENGGEDDYDGKGHRLISEASESQRQNPEHISYYYRQNPNPYHSTWNPRGFTESGSENEYYYGMNTEQDCDQDLDGCDDTGINEDFTFSFLWQNQGQTVEDYDLVRSPNA